MQTVWGLEPLRRATTGVPRVTEIHLPAPAGLAAGGERRIHQLSAREWGQCLPLWQVTSNGRGSPNSDGVPGPSDFQSPLPAGSRIWVHRQCHRYSTRHDRCGSAPVPCAHAAREPVSIGEGTAPTGCADAAVAGSLGGVRASARGVGCGGREHVAGRLEASRYEDFLVVLFRRLRRARLQWHRVRDLRTETGRDSGALANTAWICWRSGLLDPARVLASCAIELGLAERPQRGRIRGMAEETLAPIAEALPVGYLCRSFMRSTDARVYVTVGCELGLKVQTRRQGRRTR